LQLALCGLIHASLDEAVPENGHRTCASAGGGVGAANSEAQALLATTDAGLSDAASDEIAARVALFCCDGASGST